jgi:hypothetical protein
MRFSKAKVLRKNQILDVCFLVFAAFIITACAHPSERSSVVSNQPEKSDSSSASAAMGTPVLVAPEPVYDFGRRKAKGAILHDFTLMNEGTGDLRIEKILPT